MAQLTRSEARDLIRQLIDDPGAKLWSRTNLNLLIEGCLDELWGELLDAFPWLRSTETSALTPTSPGYVDLTDEASFVERFYRVQQVVRDGVLLQPADPKDVLIANGEAVYAPQNTYIILGDELHMFPYSTSADVYIRYSSYPERFTQVLDDDPEGDDSDDLPVIWPDGYHMAYVYDVASKAIEKGDREDSTRLGRRAEASLFRLKAYLRKQHLGPVMPFTSDDGYASV